MTQHHDQRNDPARPRLRWTPPQVRRLAAGDAENGFLNLTADGGTTFSS